MPTDFYEVLGISREATDDEIKKAYRRLARQYHPDANDGDPAAEARFKELSAAYDTLRDPDKRRGYDMYGAEGMGAGAGGPNMGGFDCGVAGEVRTVRRTILGQMMTATPCTACRGTGREILSPCRDCRGDGRVTLPATVEVQVPAGIDDGQRLRLAGRGPAAPRGGEPGDLYVSIAVRPHPRFERDGDDLLHVLRLPMTQAALGAHLRIDTLDGEEDLLVPAGTQTGKVFKLRGRGVPSLRGRGRGDLIVPVEVIVPEKLSAEEAQLIRRLAELRGEDVAPREEGFFSRIKSAFQ